MNEYPVFSSLQKGYDPLWMLSRYENLTLHNLTR